MVIGGGGREHAIVWKLKQSSIVNKIYAAPGNGGIASLAQILDIDPTDYSHILASVDTNKIDLVIIGPEAPLAAGIVDEFQSRFIPVFGPTKAAAQLEASKTYARFLMEKYTIPCARGQDFDEFDQAMTYVNTQDFPLVIKADGLAAGKGVIICNNLEEAEAALLKIMCNRVFGSAGDKVVIEECLVGQEVSFLAFTDGKTISSMPAVCDYKRVFDGDKGLNTGGMGAYSPPPFFTDRLATQIESTVMYPIIRALNSEGISYKGIIYAGLMLTHQGPKVLEFNARFGDPETQVILPQLKTDLAEIIVRIINGELEKCAIEWEDKKCVNIVMASGGYPEHYNKGFVIKGLDDINNDAIVFHAGTQILDNGQLITSGGRVLNVTSCAETFDEARHNAYSNINKIAFNGAHYRNDIAQHAQ